MKTTILDWIKELNKNNTPLSAIKYFIDSEDIPILYLDYCLNKALLQLKFAKNTPPILNLEKNILLFENEPSFHSSLLYTPHKIPTLHLQIQKWLNQNHYHSYPLVFRGQIKGIFLGTWSNETNNERLKTRLFILHQYLKNFLWEEIYSHHTIVDEITGYLTQKAFLKQLFIEISRARRLNLPISIILMKIDQFEALTKLYDSYKTNILIKVLCDYISSNSRSYDLLASWPSGNLGMILPHSSQKAASIKAERTRWIMQSTNFSKIFTEHNRLTMSLAIAEYPSIARSSEDLFRACQKALNFSHKDCSGDMISLAIASPKFKPDFSVSQEQKNLLDFM